MYLCFATGSFELSVAFECFAVGSEIFWPRKSICRGPVAAVGVQSPSEITPSILIHVIHSHLYFCVYILETKTVK